MEPPINTLQEAVNRASLMPVCLLLLFGGLAILSIHGYRQTSRLVCRRHLLTYALIVSSLPVLWGVLAPTLQGWFGWLSGFGNDTHQIWGLGKVSVVYFAISGCLFWIGSLVIPVRDNN